MFRHCKDGTISIPSNSQTPSKAKNGKTIKLFVNKSVKSLVCFQTTQGDIYYNSADEDMNKLYKKIMQWRGL